MAQEPDLLEKIVRIVNFRVIEGLTESGAELTNNLVNSQVEVGLVAPEEADELVDNVLEIAVSLFLLFADDVELELDDGEFDIEGSFILGAESNGIDPLTEKVNLQVGTLSITIPAGSFDVDDGAFEFDGVINGVELEATIERSGPGFFEFEVSGDGANLTGTANPVTVSLAIGNDIGVVVVKAEIDDG